MRYELARPSYACKWSSTTVVQVQGYCTVYNPHFPQSSATEEDPLHQQTKGVGTTPKPAAVKLKAFQIGIERCRQHRVTVRRSQRVIIIRTSYSFGNCWRNSILSFGSTSRSIPSSSPVLISAGGPSEADPGPKVSSSDSPKNNVRFRFRNTGSFK